MDVTIKPAGGLCGTIQAISSKSDVHRALICAALAGHETTVFCNLLSKDMEATANCLNALGAHIRYDSAAQCFFVTPIREESGKKAEAEGREVILDCGESGSTLRFLIPVAAALGKRVCFTGHGRLPERPVGVLMEELRRHGVTADRDALPIRMSGRLLSGRFSLPGNVSSQFVTGLLLAFPLLAGDSRLELTTELESRDYVEVTRDVMRRFGVRIEETKNGFAYLHEEAADPGGTAKSDETPKPDEWANPCEIYHIPSGRYETDGDWSNAAFFLCADALNRLRGAQRPVPQITVTGLRANSPQADKRIFSIIREAERDGQFSFDASTAPDLVPIASVLAAFLSGTSEITHAQRLRLKECDRLRAMTETLLAIGADVTEHADGLTIRGKKHLPGGAAVSGWNDHRVVMAMAIAACYCDAPVTILGAEAVDKSYPGFFEALRSLGGSVSAEPEPEDLVSEESGGRRICNAVRG